MLVYLVVGGWVLAKSFLKDFFPKRSIWIKSSTSVGNIELAGMERPF